MNCLQLAIIQVKREGKLNKKGDISLILERMVTINKWLNNSRGIKRSKVV